MNTGVFFLGMKAEYATAQGCPLNCREGALFMKCKCEADKKIVPAPCNCCNVKADCTIYFKDGPPTECSAN